MLCAGCRNLSFASQAATVDAPPDRDSRSRQKWFAFDPASSHIVNAAEARMYALKMPLQDFDGSGAREGQERTDCRASASCPKRRLPAIAISRWT